MNTTTYDINKIVSIEIESRKLEKNIYYLNTKNMKPSFWNKLFRTLKKEGWYYEDLWSRLHGPYTDEELRSGALWKINFQIFGDNAYYKPFLRINFVDGSKFGEHFESEEDIKKFLDVHKIWISRNFEIRRINNEK